MEDKGEVKRIPDKIKRVSGEIFFEIVETLLLRDRIEARVVREFMGGFAFAVGVTYAGGLVLKSFFSSPPPWVDASIQVIALVGEAFGLFIAITSWQECTVWVIPKGSSKAPYVLFIPSIILLGCGVMTIVTAPLAFVSAFLFSYEIPIKLECTNLPLFSVQSFYLNFLSLLLFAAIQKAMSAIIRSRRNICSIHVNKMRIAKYLLVLAVNILFLILNSRESLKRFTFTFIPSLLIWYASLSAHWEPVDKEERRGLAQKLLRRALFRSIISLPLVLFLVYGISLAFIRWIMPYLPQGPFVTLF